MPFFQFLMSQDLNSALSSEPGVKSLSSVFGGVLKMFSDFSHLGPGVTLPYSDFDLLIILFFVVAAIVYGFTFGKDKIVLMLISLYMCVAIFKSAPDLRGLLPENYGINNIFAVKIGAFLGMFAVLLFILSRSRPMRILARSESPVGWWQVVIFSVLNIGLLVSFTVSLIPEEYYLQLSVFTKEWFLGQHAQFFWILCPVLAMAFFGRRAS